VEGLRHPIFKRALFFLVEPIRASWTDRIWARRYQAILVSNEEAAQVDRLTYSLAQGVKENLVARVVRSHSGG
jgi:hypothetical protein